MALKNAFIQHRVENVCSASHDVTGIVHTNFSKVETLGNSLLSHGFNAVIELSGS